MSISPSAQLFHPNQMFIVGDDPAGGRGGLAYKNMHLVVGQFQDRQGDHHLALPLTVLDAGRRDNTYGVSRYYNQTSYQESLTPLTQIDYQA